MRSYLVQRRRMLAVALALLAGGLGMEAQTPTPPQTPSAPQSPSAPQLPTAPEEPMSPQAPSLPQEPTAPQAPASPQEPTAPQLPTLPEAAVSPGGFPAGSQPSPPDAGAATLASSAGTIQAVAVPQTIPRTNLAAGGGRSFSNIPGNARFPSRPAAVVPSVEVAVTAPQPAPRETTGMAFWWGLAIVMSLAATFYFARKIWLARVPASNVNPDGAPPA